MVKSGLEALFCAHDMAEPSPPDAHESSSTHHVRVPSLDGLRGLAVLLVLVSHASNIGVWLGPWFDCRGVGRYGVFLFFVLSAYLLTRQFFELSPSSQARPKNSAARVSLGSIPLARRPDHSI